MFVGDFSGYAKTPGLEGVRNCQKIWRKTGKVAADAIKANDTSEKMLSKYEENWRKSISSKINAAYKVQNRWIGLSDEQWDKEIEIINELNADEFLDFIRADFGLSSIIRVAAHHPRLAVRQLFSMVKTAQKN